MRHSLRYICLYLILLLLTACTTVRQCDSGMIAYPSLEKAIALSQKTEENFNASGAKVVLLARAGKSLEEYQIQYSHMGFAYKKPNNDWEIVHLLNDCGGSSSNLYRQGLTMFFLDGLHEYKTGWVIPPTTEQEILWKVLQDTTYLKERHDPNYNMVAYPWSTKRQQSNQWVLEIYAAALHPDSITNREQAQDWLRTEQYIPTSIPAGVFKRNLANWFIPNFFLEGQPQAPLDAGFIQTVTVDSAFDWFVMRRKFSPVQTTVLP